MAAMAADIHSSSCSGSSPSQGMLWACSPGQKSTKTTNYNKLGTTGTSQRRELAHTNAQRENLSHLSALQGATPSSFPSHSNLATTSPTKTTLYCYSNCRVDYGKKPFCISSTTTTFVTNSLAKYNYNNKKLHAMHVQHTCPLLC